MFFYNNLLNQRIFFSSHTKFLLTWMMFTVDRNGFLDLSTLKAIFPNVDHLTYKNNNNIFEAVPKIDDSFLIPPDIREFSIRCRQTL